MKQVKLLLLLDQNCNQLDFNIKTPSIFGRSFFCAFLFAFHRKKNETILRLVGDGIQLSPKNQFMENISER